MKMTLIDICALVFLSGVFTASGCREDSVKWIQYGLGFREADTSSANEWKIVMKEKAVLLARLHCVDLRIGSLITLKFSLKNPPPEFGLNSLLLFDMEKNFSRANH